MSSPEISINGRKIRPVYPPLVVAEIGINQGSLAVAKEMVDAAARASIEVVKHQTHIVEDEMSGRQGVVPRQRFDLRDHATLRVVGIRREAVAKMSN
jgi:N-acetylneuraminate synthase